MQALGIALGIPMIHNPQASLTPVLDSKTLLWRFKASDGPKNLVGENPDNGHHIQSWVDTVSGITLTASGAHRRPTYRSAHAGAGGLPSVEFTTDDALTVGGLSLVNTGIAVFVVANIIDNSMNFRATVSVHQTSEIYLTHLNNGHIYFIGLASSYDTNAADVRRIYAAKSTSSSRDIWINGLLETDASDSHNSNNITALSMGARIDSSGNVLTTVPNALIQEFIGLSSDQVSDVEMVTIQQELEALYNL